MMVQAMCIYKPESPGVEHPGVLAPKVSLEGLLSSCPPSEPLSLPEAPPSERTTAGGLKLNDSCPGLATPPEPYPWSDARAGLLGVPGCSEVAARSASDSWLPLQGLLL